MTVELHYVDEGPRDAPVLVLSGSLGSTVEMWRPQVRPLTERFRLIRVDHRGHGGSPTPSGPYRVADLAGDVLAMLDRLELERVAWCGLSLGGMVGMYLASEAPERISRLTACCTSAHFPDPAVWHDRIAAIKEHGLATIAPNVVARWFTEEWAAAHPDAIELATEMVTQTPEAGYLGCCEALAVWDHRDRLNAITAPTLVIAGADDPATPVEPHARTIAHGIPGAQLEILKASHLATIEAATRATALIAAHSMP